MFYVMRVTYRSTVQRELFNNGLRDIIRSKQGENADGMPYARLKQVVTLTRVPLFLDRWM